MTKHYLKIADQVSVVKFFTDNFCIRMRKAELVFIKKYPRKTYTYLLLNIST